MLSQTFLGSLATLLLFGTVSANTVASDCPCYTQTAFSYHPCPMLKCGPRPLCLLLKTTTIPGPNPTCTSTPTVTVPASCTTTCQRGCGTSLKTVTADSPCVASGAHDGRPSTPGLITPTPLSPKPPRATRTEQTMIPALSPSPSCFTYTHVPRVEYCPSATTKICAEPACVLLKTITYPAKRSDCPVTPTVTATPSCLPSCGRGCGTAYTTVTLGTEISESPVEAMD